jgi:hypothetical protein
LRIDGQVDADIDAELRQRRRDRAKQQSEHSQCLAHDEYLRIARPAERGRDEYVDFAGNAPFAV